MFLPIARRAIIATWLACTAHAVAAQSACVWTERSGIWIEERDLVTLEVLRTAIPPTPTPGSNWGVCFDGERLWSLDTHPNNSVLHSTNPADGITGIVGPTGLSTWSGLIHGIDAEPQSGLVWLSLGRDFYLLDKLVGIASFQGTISGLLPFDGVAALAIESPGLAYGTGLRLTSVPQVALYQLDLVSFSASLIGLIQMPHLGDFTDLALLPNGDLLGIYMRLGNPGTTPIFRIDTQTATATWVVGDPPGPVATYFSGIAVGPGTVMSTYCTAKTNSAGCAPMISGLGFASVAGTSGFTISARNALNQRGGVLAWTAAGLASTPFGGGTLCVANPFMRTQPLFSGGSTMPTIDCSGMWSIDVNSYLQSLPSLPAGTTLHCQWLGRDPGYAPPQNLQLSNALTFTLKP